MTRNKITVLPDGTIKALDVNTQQYVYIENKIVDDNWNFTLERNGHLLAIKWLTNDAIADSAKKLRYRHGRTAQAQEKDNVMASKLEWAMWFIKRMVSRFHN